MKWTIVWTFLFIMGMSTGFQPMFAQENNTEKESADSTKSEEKGEDKSKKKKPKEPKFEDLIEGYVKSEGLFTIYSDSKEGKKQPGCFRAPRRSSPGGRTASPRCRRIQDPNQRGSLDYRSSLAFIFFFNSCSA